MSPTRDEILKLPDADLVRLVAERVMEWHLWTKPYDDDRYQIDRREPAVRQRLPNGTDRLWSPLSDWNHTMQVVEAVRAKLFSVRMKFMSALQNVVSDKVLDDSEHHIVAWPDVFWYADKKSIMQAALIAVEATT